MGLSEHEWAALRSLGPGDGTDDTDGAPESSLLVLRMRIAFHDVDMLRHVNSVAFVRWAEVLRDRLQVELLGEDVTGRRAFVVRALSMEYLATARHAERILATIDVGKVGRTSFRFRYRFVRVDDGVELARGESVMIAYDAELGAAIEVPPEWVAAFRRGVVIVVGESTDIDTVAGAEFDGAGAAAG